MTEGERQEAEATLPNLPDEMVVSAVLSTLNPEDSEDKKPKFVFTFYANNSRYMEIAADQIHMTHSMEEAMESILASRSRKHACKCKKEGGGACHA